MRKLAPKDFKGKDLKTDAPTGVLFYAKRCPYCQAFKPIFTALRPKGFKLALADISDEDNPLWEIFGIKVIPTLIAFRAGKPFWRKDGARLQGLKEKDLGEMVSALKQ
ncbi:MAG: thioredoxin family protein [Thermoplasmata archaeon]|nr:thioredoxin family protein [Thermoplasmata archaeon]